ncbi:hypothetical protein, partial [Pluralibacter gergoviae]|uniref:hypothetical protein n=1 Tax=Pluralibacter gergoviae TaxID=61647 RepID=UPI001E3E41A8
SPSYNCQASNKRESLMRKHGAFSFVRCLPVSALREQDKFAGSEFALRYCCLGHPALLMYQIQ